jgi:hypothetical protein
MRGIISPQALRTRANTTSSREIKMNTKAASPTGKALVSIVDTSYTRNTAKKA